MASTSRERVKQGLAVGLGDRGDQRRTQGTFIRFAPSLTSLSGHERDGRRDNRKTRERVAESSNCRPTSEREAGIPGC